MSLGINQQKFHDSVYWENYNKKKYKKKTCHSYRLYY